MRLGAMQSLNHFKPFRKHLSLFIQPVEISDHNVKDLPLGARKSLLGVSRNEHLISLTTEHSFQRGRHALFILNDQNSRHNLKLPPSVWVVPPERWHRDHPCSRTSKLLRAS